LSAADERQSVRFGSVIAGAWGLLDQAVISAANLVVLVILARSLAPHDFGAFTLVFGAMLIANYAQTAFVTQPHNVIGVALSARKYRAYTRSAFLMQLSFSSALAVGVAGAALLAHAVSSDYAGLLLAAAAALPPWQLQEFIRRVLYTEAWQKLAFANDVLAYGGLAAGVAALALADVQSAPAALAVLAISSAVAAAVGLAQIRSSLREARASANVVLENVHFGKWLAASFAAQWTVTQAYLYIAAVLLGVAVTGALKAVQLVLSPLHVLFFSLSTMLPIHLARTLGHHDSTPPSAFDRELRLVFRLSFPVVVAYCAFVALLADEILTFVYGTTYARYGSVLVIVAGYYVLLYVVFLGSAVLTARRQTNRLFLANAVGAFVTVAAAWPLMHRFHAEGAALLLVLSAGALSVALWQGWGEAQPGARPRADSESTGLG
jgi:O-antigen/teichoic acid export membrane protein